MLERLDNCLADYGMEVLGCFSFTYNELKQFSQPNSIGIMIASCGRSMWSIFKCSMQFSDGRANPLERWSAEVLTATAVEFNAQLLLPFDKPFPPFQQWAIRAAGLHQSPLGLLIHPDYGLWFGLRAVMVLNAAEFADIEKPVAHDNLCEQCEDKPCHYACPVRAFAENTLNTGKCFSHLKTNNQPDCKSEGCKARNACPIGNAHRYCAQQLQFHMAAYCGQLKN